MNKHVIIMKFGGTCLATATKRLIARERVLATRDPDTAPVVVVSAMGRKGDPYATDTLLGLVDGDTSPPARELDALTSTGEDMSAALFAMGLEAMGTRAVSLRGFQAGIRTAGPHGDARIHSIDPEPIRRAIAEGAIPVISGFQGIADDGAITTLGRGGSDTSAVALGLALGAQRVEIYTDVDGVYSADPRVEPTARRIDMLTYQEASEMAVCGAKVLHPRAAELAEAHGVDVRILSPEAREPGTALARALPSPSAVGSESVQTYATAVTSKADIAHFTIHSFEIGEDLHTSRAMFDAIADAAVSLDMISVMEDRILFTTPRERAGDVAGLLTDLGLDHTINLHRAKVTVVGGAIHGVPGIMARIVGALGDEEIRVFQSVDSHTIIAILVDSARADDAVRALHRAFAL